MWWVGNQIAFMYFFKILFVLYDGWVLISLDWYIFKLWNYFLTTYLAFLSSLKRNKNVIVQFEQRSIYVWYIQHCLWYSKYVRIWNKKSNSCTNYLNLDILVQIQEEWFSHNIFAYDEEYIFHNISKRKKAWMDPDQPSI